MKSPKSHLQNTHCYCIDMWLILYTSLLFCDLAKFIFMSREFSIDSLNCSIYIIMSSIGKDNFTSLYSIYLSFISFSLLISLTRTSSDKYNICVILSGSSACQLFFLLVLVLVNLFQKTWHFSFICQVCGLNFFIVTHNILMCVGYPVLPPLWFLLLIF